MDYNTQRPGMKLREYGRNIQYMVEHLTTIKDDERRNKAAHALIDLMGQLNPHLRIEEFRPKLWDHLIRMANFELEVDFPYEVQELKIDNYDANRPPYPDEHIKMKQYGKNVENLIDKAVQIEDSEKRQAFARSIGNYMKMVASSNYQGHVDDLSIREDLKVLSKGRLVIDESSNLDKLTESNSHKNSRQGGSSGSSTSKGGKNFKSKRKSSNNRNSNNNSGGRYRKNDNGGNKSSSFKRR